jgi:tryptophan 2,3-dioxygenase
MSDNSIDPDLIRQLKKLQEKYDVMGQDISSYLDGLLHSDYLTYWEYIHLDTLLSLQTPRTQFPDEKVFIGYHQITELYFQLILHELDQISAKAEPDEIFFATRLDRVIRYFRHLTDSFEIMVDGLDKEQFLKFRMALLPSSGFQSGQYRLIEIQSTDMINLVSTEQREKLRSDTDLKRLLENLYWRSGATELASGKKTLTLQQFEAKYMVTFYKTAVQYKDVNIWQLYKTKFSSSENSDAIVRKLRTYDSLANVHWRLSHLKAAGKYLFKDPDELKATGGTNWQLYLPPRFQRIMFFPDLWSEEEKAEWGKAAFIKRSSEV